MKLRFFILFSLIWAQNASAGTIDPGAFFLTGNYKFVLPAPEDTTVIKVNICPNDSVVINGTVYNAANPSGVQVITGGSVNGTDSVILVLLTLLEPGEYFFTQTFCNNQALLIGNGFYDPSHPVGEELLPGMAFNGCDSLIHVNLTFEDAPVYDLEQTICDGDTLWVGNTPYHAGFYLGTEVLQGASYLGCDSTVNVELTVVPKPVDTLTVTICREDIFFSTVRSMTCNTRKEKKSWKTPQSTAAIRRWWSGFPFTKHLPVTSVRIKASAGAIRFV